MLEHIRLALSEDHNNDHVTSHDVYAIIVLYHVPTKQTSLLKTESVFSSAYITQTPLILPCDIERHKFGYIDGVFVNQKDHQVSETSFSLMIDTPK